MKQTFILNLKVHPHHEKDSFVRSSYAQSQVFFVFVIVCAPLNNFNISLFVT